MNRLLQIGFKQVGYWKHHKTNPDWVEAQLDTVARHPNVLYAFVINGDVKYVGKTAKTLKGRMGNYMRAVTDTNDSTNKRNANKILAALRDQQQVDIFALPDEELHHYGAFHLNLAAGLEDSIIDVLKPSWNGGKKDEVNPANDIDPEKVFAPVQLPPPGTPQPTPLPAPPPDVKQTVQVKMGATYYEKGFFNIGVEASANLGADFQTIELYLGDMVTPLLGTINRRANANGTPRIMVGKRFTDWVKKVMAQDDELRVEVLTPTAIRLSPETMQA